MCLYHVLVDYLFHINPSGSVGYAAVLLQWALHVLTPGKLIMQAIRRENGSEKFLLAIMPLTPIAIWGLLEPFLKSSFLGCDMRETEALFAYVNQPAVYWEFMAIVMGYLLSFLYFRVWKRTVATALSIVADVLELGMYFFCLALTAGGLTNQGAFFMSAGTFGLKGHYLLLLYIYFMFTLAFKLFGHVVALVWGILFSERKRKSHQVNAKKEFLRFLRKGHKIVVISLAMFIAMWCGLWYWIEASEGGFSLGGTFIMLPMFFFLRSLIVLIVPTRTKAYRNLVNSGNRELLLELFYKEYLSEEGKTKIKNFINVDVTEHFVVSKTPFLQLGYRPLYKGYQKENTGYSLLFAGGGKVLIRDFDKGVIPVLEHS